jgi:hypothetical protein
LTYEPDVVELRGAVVRGTFPGPPKYSDISQGDKSETAWILNLVEAVCVEPKASDSLYPGLSGVMRVQLVLDPGQYKKFLPLLEQKVAVSGKLFSAHTGHHHTKLLITVKDIRALAPE